MHSTAYEEVSLFCQRYEARVRGKDVADVGAYNVNGCTRPLFDALGCRYVGLDCASGPNVDLVIPVDPPWPNVASESFDVVVTVSTLEHTRRPWRVMEEIARILRPGGIVCAVAPYAWVFHEHPIDCWRIYPDGFRTIAQDAGLVVESAHMRPCGPSGDTVLIATKPSDVRSDR